MAAREVPFLLDPASPADEFECRLVGLRDPPPGCAHSIACPGGIRPLPHTSSEIHGFSAEHEADGPAHRACAFFGCTEVAAQANTDCAVALVCA